MEELEKDKYLVVKKENYNPETGEIEINKKAKYFVLRLDTDSKAREALKTYIVELIKAGELTFADQLNDWLNSIPIKGEPVNRLSTKGICPVCGKTDSTKQTKKGKIEGKEVVIDQQIICNVCGVVRKF